MDKYLQMPLPNTKRTSSDDIERRKRQVIKTDITKIKSAIQSNDEQLIKDLHIELDGKYSAYVPNWGHSMYGYIDKHGFSYEYLDIDSLIHNLTLMKHSLEGFAMGLDRTTKKSYDTSKNNVSVTVNNKVENDVEISISITFEQARQQVENMTSLTDEQTKEILDKITDIENVGNGSGNKKSKWEKIKTILTWLADKSFDVGMTLLPLLLKIQG